MHMFNTGKTFTFVVVLIVLAYVLAAIAPVLDGIAQCDTYGGYNPHGTAVSDMYPPGTWAGTCKVVKDVVMVVPQALNRIFAPFIIV